MTIRKYLSFPGLPNTVFYFFILLWMNIDLSNTIVISVEIILNFFSSDLLKWYITLLFPNVETALQISNKPCLLDYDIFMWKKIIALEILWTIYKFQISIEELNSRTDP